MTFLSGKLSYRLRKLELGEWQARERLLAAFPGTIGGLVMDSLGRIPQVGDVVKIQGIHLQVEAVDHRSVTGVCVSLPSEEMA